MPTCSREGLASRLVDFVPRELPLHDAVLYTTSGTSGHALSVLHHPGAVAKNHAFGSGPWPSTPSPPRSSRASRAR
ncbi:MAG: hypothetical protein IPI43_11325 [Sandaracinaceae bacterium]|nr:hypothetical protein [Sandaracinaceae bacterium]